MIPLGPRGVERLEPGEEGAEELAPARDARMPRGLASAFSRRMAHDSSARCRLESPGQSGNEDAMRTELWRLSATEAVGLLKRREVSPVELVEAALARIEATNPRINAIVTLCAGRALAHARRLEKGPVGEVPPHFLYGLPIAVKDGTDVQGVRCTSGSRIYAERIAPASDVVVERLEANGAIVIGKSNLPEFAAGGNTFNEVFGATLNPWDTRTTSSGSSGGSA